MTITLFDEFAGAGGTTQGFAQVPGMEPILAANHDVNAVESHAANFPNVDHYRGDIEAVDMATFPRADYFHSSPACFVAGTLILSRRGLVPIEEIRVGDKVFTHMRRWRSVTSTMSRNAPTVVVRGVGLPSGIETTAEHPFYTRRRESVWRNESRRYRIELTSGSVWTNASDLIGHAWATPIEFADASDVPSVPGFSADLDGDFWWMVGRWLGDGHLRIHPRRSERQKAGSKPGVARVQPVGSSCQRCSKPARAYGKGTTDSASLYCSAECANRRTATYDPMQSRYELTISCGKHETEDLRKRLNAVTGLTWGFREKRTTDAFTTSRRGLVEWLAEHFGQHAHGKTIPAWALSMPAAWRAALIDGYLSADGHRGAYTTASTVSKRLALGVRLLVNATGGVANMKGPYVRGTERTIEGRPVNERPIWEVSWLTAGPKHAFHLDADGYRWAPVKQVTTTGRTEEVYNFSVDEDESYLAEGITVHNCPAWSNARGERRDFDKSTQPSLFDDDGPDEATARSRALMEEVPRYLRAMRLRGEPVWIGSVENVVECRKWDQWNRWLKEIQAEGYKTRVIAFNSMHATPRNSHRAPQSRDRLYVAYWHVSLGRDPDWDKWLRPTAYCPTCETTVKAMQVFKKPGDDMGRYRSQYVYRCPNATCRYQAVEPMVLPAAVAIDWTLPGKRIGDWQQHRTRPYAPATLARIEAGLKKYARPFTYAAAGHTFERTPGVRTWPVDAPLVTQTSTATVGFACPPLLVEGRPGKAAQTVDEPSRTQTGRNETALAWLPFQVPLRGGGDKERAKPITDPLGTFSAGGLHHGLAFGTEFAAAMMRNLTARGNPGQMLSPVSEEMRTLTASNVQSLVSWQHLLVPYYGSSDCAQPISEPIGTFTTRDRYAFASAAGDIHIDDVLLRMLEPHEIGRGMAFADDYIVLGSKRVRVSLYGRAVTPPVAEVIGCALVECLTGEPIEPRA